MKKYMTLIGIYALSVVYMITYVVSIIGYHISAFNDFFLKHFSLYYFGKHVISIIFFALFGILAVHFCKFPKQGKQEIVIDLLIIDLPALLGVTIYFWWGKLGNIISGSSLNGSWLDLFLTDENFHQTAMIIGSIMLGVEIMRYIECFKHKSELI